MLLTGSEYGQRKLLEALGLPNDMHEPRWPLPNLKPSSETAFWNHQTSYGYTCKAHVLHQRVDGRHADIFIFRQPDVYDFVDGGFAIVVLRNSYPEPVTLQYFEWRACDHKFDCVESRNCYRKYKCTKCGKGYDEHSD